MKYKQLTILDEQAAWKMIDKLIESGEERDPLEVIYITGITSINKLHRLGDDVEFEVVKYSPKNVASKLTHEEASLIKQLTKKENNNE